MKKIRKIFFSVLSLLLILTILDVGNLMPAYTAQAAENGQNTYYVDSAGGNDNNDGTSPETAWKSLEKVNGTTFQPADELLFKKGGAWNGLLWPKGSGEANKPIIIDMYGEGDNKPIINGGGSSTKDPENKMGEGSAVFFYNQPYWEINNLEVTNQGEKKAHRVGVRILAEDYGTVSHIYIKNVDVHDVNGDYSDKYKRSGGIQLNIIGNKTITKYDDILVEGCTVKNVARTGIQIGVSSWRNRHSYTSGEGEWVPSTNVAVRNCFVDTIGGDGILIRECEGQLVEYNVAKDCNFDGKVANVAIWPWNSNGAVFQYNEAYNTRSTYDGEGFDCDYLCHDTTMQYNYSHDNEGGFILVCSPGREKVNLNNVIRYNISENDRHRVFRVDGGGTNDTRIYNNTIYLDESLKDTGIKMFSHGKWGGYAQNTFYYNNIFYNLAGATYDFGNSANTVFENNCFYGGSLPKESAQVTVAKNNIQADPEFAEAGAGAGATGIDFKDKNRLPGYRLAIDSPCVNAGKKLEANGGQDFWGNPIYKGDPDIGAFEYQDDSFVPSKEYDVTTGNNSIWESNIVEGLTFGFEGGEGTVTEVFIDGEKLQEDVYFAENSSLLLHSEYLQRLARGKHILKIKFSDGFAYAAFSVIKYGETKYECEALAANSNATRKVYTDLNASGGKVDSLETKSNNKYIEYTVPDVATGKYTVKVGVKRNFNKGIYRLSINSDNQGEKQDQYSASTLLAEDDLGEVEFSESGSKKFKFLVIGKNDASPEYNLMFDYILLEPVETQPLERIEVTLPTKTEYQVGDAFDPAGMEIKAVYSNGTSKTVDFEDCEISGFDSTTTGEKTITVTYGGKTAAFTVNVQEKRKYECEDLEAEVTRVREQYDKPKASGGRADSLICGTANNHIEYTIPFVATGRYTVKIGIISNFNKGIYQLSIDGANQGSEQDQYSATEQVQEHNLGEVEFSEPGSKKFKFLVTEKNEASSGYSLMFDYILLEPVETQTLENIEVTPPTKTEYQVGDAFDPAGMEIKAIYSDGTSKTIAVEDCEISGFDSTAAGEKTITVTYGGKTADFTVTVTTPDVNMWKVLLKQTIDAAEEAAENLPEHIIPAVEQKFKAALAAAWAAYNNPDATDDELISADDLLITMMQYLSFTANPEDLQKAVDKADGIIASDKYIADTAFEDYKALRDEANVLLADDYATDTEYNKMIAALDEAEAKLTLKPVVPLDLSILEHQIKLSKLINLNDYLDLPANEAFTKALKAAEAMLEEAKKEGTAVTQDDINKAAQELQRARGNLRLKPSKEQLEKILNDAKAYNLALYTAESGARLTAAVEAAEAVMNNPNAEEADIAAAAKALETAMENMVKNPGDNNGSGSGNENNVPTGDTLPIGLAALGTLSLGVLLLLRKRNTK